MDWAAKIFTYDEYPNIKIHNIMTRQDPKRWQNIAVLSADTYAVIESLDSNPQWTENKTKLSGVWVTEKLRFVENQGSVTLPTELQEGAHNKVIAWTWQRDTFSPNEDEGNSAPADKIVTCSALAQVPKTDGLIPNLELLKITNTDWAFYQLVINIPCTNLPLYDGYYFNFSPSRISDIPDLIPDTGSEGGNVTPA